jgi:hypothetical protein
VIVRAPMVISLVGMVLGACASEEVVDDPATYVIDFEVVAEGIAQHDEAARARILLARSGMEGDRAARRIGIDEVATILRSWTRYRALALITLVGSPSGGGSRLQVELVQGPALIDEVAVTARTEPLPELSPDPPAAPWVVLSVQGGEVEAATRCILRLDGEDLTSRCAPVER